MKDILSIVMPVLDEASWLEGTLSSLSLTASEELVVVDGGSRDGTVSIARRFARKVVEAPRGRARQMNLGARESRGGLLMFLHADCIPPEGAFDKIRNALSRPGVSAGAFDLSIGHPAPLFRLIELGANLRSRATRVPYGDQGLFVKRSTFERIGGFGDLPLMEDIEIAGRLKRQGSIVFLRPPIRTSPRRWLKEGPLYTTLRDWSLALSFTLLGVSPERLARHYRDAR